MFTKKKHKRVDDSGYSAINNFILWGYQGLDVSVKWLYIGLLAQDNSLNGELPTGSICPAMIEASQRKLADMLQTPYSTFRNRLDVLKLNKLAYVNPDFNSKIQLLVPDRDQVQQATNFKISILKKKNNLQSHKLGFTLVPNSLIYAYPEILPAAKYVYVLIKSLDWTGIGANWHGKRKLAELAGIKYRTFKKYLRELQNASLICITKKMGIYKKTIAIFYNAPNKIEQARANVFKTILRSKKAFNRIETNYIFDSMPHAAT